MYVFKTKFISGHKFLKSMIENSYFHSSRILQYAKNQFKMLKIT